MTKNLKKVLGLAALVMLCAAFLTTPGARADNLQDAQQKWYSQNAASAYQAGLGSAPVVNLSFNSAAISSGAAAVSTGAYVTISATAMTFYQPFGTVDNTIGAAGVVTYLTTPSSNTIGAFCDYVNLRGRGYKCTLLNARRNDIVGGLITTQTETDGTNNLAAAGGFSILQATTNFVGIGIYPAKDKSIILRNCSAITQSNGTGNNLYVYGLLSKYKVGPPYIGGQPTGTDIVGNTVDDSYLVYASSAVAATQVNAPNAYWNSDWLQFAPNAHVVVRAGLFNGGNATAETVNSYVNCIWSER